MERRIFLKYTGSVAMGTLLLNQIKAANIVNGISQNELIYDLQDGWVDNWLLAGPQLIPIADASYKWVPALRPPIMLQFHRDEPLVEAPFVEGANFKVEDANLSWRYYSCQDDHLVDLADWYGNSRFVRVWAYVEIGSPENREVGMQLFSNGPSDIWMNGSHILRTESFDYANPICHEFPASLQVGKNTFLVRQEMPVSLNTAMSLALRVTNEGGDGLKVHIPVQTVDFKRRQGLEDAFLMVYATQDIYTREEELRLALPQLAQDMGLVTVDVMDGKIKKKSLNWNTGQQPKELSLGKIGELPTGGYRVVLSGADNHSEISLRVLEQVWHGAPQSGKSYETRRLEVLKVVASHAGEALDPKAKTPVNMWNGAVLHGEIAKMELGNWKDVHTSTLISFIEGVSLVEDGCDFRMLDLMGMQIRYGKKTQFPAEVGAALRKCALGFRYWIDEPGQTSANYLTENHRFAFHASEILAGQLYPNDIFTNNGKSGDWHKQHGEQLALEWIYKRGQYGFEEWDANGYLCADVVLLTHLADLSQDPKVKAMARAVTDKIFLSVAINSFKGCFGSTHGRTAVDYVKDARNEPMAGLAYIGWGIGILEHADSAAAIAFAHYEVPEVIQSIALDQPEAMWGRERTGLDPIIEKRGVPPVDKVTFKTPDFMLASAQSWRPGESGYQQHIWQATLASDAAVFVTHPACISENGNRRPNFWMGNQTLPRVSQWKDSLIAIYRPRPNDWLQWSHAYFPTFAFDEWKLEGDWAFARVGKGYLALRTQNGLRLIERGNSAMRELRSTGSDNVWLCQMGRYALDGNFASFQAKVRSLKVEFGKLCVKWENLRGEQLAFGWEEPLLLDGKEQPIENFPHFDTPYARAQWPAEKIEVRHNGESYLLDFEKNNDNH